MKIGAENYISKYTAVDASGSRTAVRESRPAEIENNYDKAEFTTRFKEAEEKIFSEKIAQITSRQVLEPKDNSSRISALRQAVESGAYTPDNREIAAKMLLLGGDR